MTISQETRQSYSEVYEFINLLDCEYIDKIPHKILEYFEREMDKNYRKNINPYEDISKNELKRETITILAMINLKYWADVNKKIELKKIYDENETIYQNEIHEKYNPDKIFEKIEEPAKTEENHQNLQQELIVVQEEKGIFRKLINFIKGKLQL